MTVDVEKKMGIRLNRLLFTAAGRDDAWVEFSDGLTIIYGGSNAGKSFVLKSLDFMFGADQLRLPKQGSDYERILLWLTLPDDQAITLERGTKGGSLHLYTGHLAPSETAVNSAVVLAPNQKGRKSKKHVESLSDFLLRHLKFAPAQLAKNEAGEKVMLSLRLMSHYVFVGEDEMISERSPIQFPETRMSSLDKSLFRYLMSGRDDANIVEVPKAENLAAARDGKIALLQEMIGNLEANGALDYAGMQEEIELASKHIEGISNVVKTYQLKIDALTAHRRATLIDRDKNFDKAAELRLMKLRFVELEALHASDIERLEALEEGALLVSVLGDTECMVCGASPEHQRHDGTLRESFEEQRHAARAESARIKRELTALRQVIDGLAEEISGLEQVSAKFEEDIWIVETELSTLRPYESTLRTSYEEAVRTRSDILERAQMHVRLIEYRKKIQELELLKIGRQRAVGLSVSIDSAIAHSFSRVVEDVLTAWHYPDMGDVHFDSSAQDIIVNGRERNDNGKGVRAILHSAFKVAMLLYCRENRLPHPGVVVLDSPLLTYRGPLQSEKHGELEDDEKAFAATTLNEHFYAHLASLSSLGQFIVLENQDPPSNTHAQAKIIRFSGEKGDGRQGFFPATQ